MIPPDDDRRANRAATYQLVDLQPEPRALAVAEPEDTRGQSLEGDALARHRNPSAQRFVVAEHLERSLVGDADVLWIARERGPAKRSAALAEERPHIFRHEARNVKRIRHASGPGLRANIVPVVERDGAGPLER